MTAPLNQQLAQVASDPRWADWLSRIDPATGWRRQHLLDEGLAESNSVRVAVLVEQFMRARATGLLAFEPYRQRAPTTSKRIYRRSEIQNLYREHQRGAWIGKEAEWNALERDLILAGKEGRVQNAEPIIINPVTERRT